MLSINQVNIISLKTAQKVFLKFKKTITDSSLCVMEATGMVLKKLYMCSLQASRYNTACMNLYQRLLVKGKPKKAALIVVVNKLLKIIFAI